MIPQEDLLFMVERATKAPSGHNTQPWLFKINIDSIEVHPNFAKSLPIVDPHNRELFISLGCAIENLRIAATVRGYNSTISIADNGVTTIGFSENETCSALFEQIVRRQTNRRVYNGLSINDSTIQELCSIFSEEGVYLHCYKKGSAEFNAISDAIRKGNMIQMSDSSFIKELKSWMRYNKSEATKSCDGLSYAVFGAPNLPRWISKSIIASVLNGKSQNRSDEKKIRSSSHFALFTTSMNTITEWINLGRYLQRFLLTCTKMGIASSFLNPPCELRELSELLAQSLTILGEYPTIILRLGYAEEMPYSLRMDSVSKIGK